MPNDSTKDSKRGKNKLCRSTDDGRPVRKFFLESLETAQPANPRAPVQERAKVTDAINTPRIRTVGFDINPARAAATQALLNSQSQHFFSPLTSDSTDAETSESTSGDANTP